MEKLSRIRYMKHIAKLKKGDVILTLCGKKKGEIDIVGDIERNENLVCGQCRRLQYMFIKKALRKGNAYMQLMSKAPVIKDYTV